MRVAIAEDSLLLREGLARLLTDSGFEVVGQCEDADELLLHVRSYLPDVAIIDIRLPPTHSDEGLRAALEIRKSYPSVGVLVLSQYVELGLALKLLSGSAEGVGYLLKDRISDVKDFLAAIRRVAAGGSALDPIIVSTLVARQRPDDPLAPPDAARTRGARADGRAAARTRGSPTASSSPFARWRSTCPASSRSSGCRPPAGSHGAFSPCSRSSAPEDTRNPPPDRQVTRLSPARLGWERELDPPRGAGHEDAHHPG